MMNIYFTGSCVFMFVDHVFVVHDKAWHCLSEELRLVHTTAAGVLDETTDSDFKIQLLSLENFLHLEWHFMEQLNTVVY